jgi:hypothetical protein
MDRQPFRVYINSVSRFGEVQTSELAPCSNSGSPYCQKRRWHCSPEALLEESVKPTFGRCVKFERIHNGRGKSSVRLTGGPRRRRRTCSVTSRWAEAREPRPRTWQQGEANQARVGQQGQRIESPKTTTIWVAG